MSDGIKAWHDEMEAEHYKENHEKDTLAIHEFIKSEKFKRLVELREKYKELRELEQLEYECKSILRQHDTASYAVKQLLNESL